MINIDKLTEELKAAGIVFSGCSTIGVIWDLQNNEIQTRSDVAAIIAAHDPNKLTVEAQAAKDALINYANLAAWAKTGTAADAETFINNQIWSGQTITQINSWIDTNITNITTANVAQINARLDFIRQGLKLVASAIINMRSLFILTSKLLIYIRDLVIRFRQ